MLFARQAIGLEISSDDAKLVLVEGKRNLVRLNAYIAAPFAPGTIKLSSREPIIKEPQIFVSAIRESYLRLLTKEKKISVALPDAIGRVMLIDLETRIKNHDEGADLIRWKLKKIVPFDINEVHLDFQVVREKDTGEVSTLVAFVARQIVLQFEELLSEAGMSPVTIDFASFNRYHLFSEKINLAEYAAFVTYFNNSVSIMIFNGGLPEFFRSKEIQGSALDMAKLFREINSSMLVYQEKYPGHIISQAYYCASVDDVEQMRELVSEAVGVEPFPLDAERFVTINNGLIADRQTLQHYTAALGAATRNL